MKFPRFLTTVAIGISSLFAFPSVHHGITYSASMTANAQWQNLPWAPSGEPGENDHVILSTDTTRNIYLNGDRTIESLSKFTGSSIRIYNGPNLNGEASDTLKIKNLVVEDGVFLFRGVSASGTHKLNVEIENITLGRPEAGTTGRISIAENENYRHINFNVTGVTTIRGYNAAVTIGRPTTGTVNLGHVVFVRDITPTGSPGIIADGAILHTKSLTNISATEDDRFTIATIRGSAVLRITGSANDPTQPYTADFNLGIRDQIRVEKTGNNLQIFSGHYNNYTGGTLIADGILSIRNTSGSGLGYGEVTVEGPGILAGNGILALQNAGVTVKTGGSIAPGADGSSGFQNMRLDGASRGEAKILTMEEGSQFTFRLNATGQTDSITFLNYAAGAFELAESGIAVNVTGELQEGVVYTLFNFHSGNAASAKTSSGLTQGLVMGNGFDGFQATFHYDDPTYGGVGTISMTVTALPVPEPSSILLLGAAVLGGVVFRKRR